jgi:hypothetical protein
MPDQDILEQIYHCKQREDETGLAYFRRLSHLCSLHTLYSDDATPPGLLLARFLNGAQPYYWKAIQIAGITNKAELHKRLHLLDGERQLELDQSLSLQSSRSRKRSHTFYTEQ